MAEVNEKVMAMVEAELKKNPDATTQELYEKAKEIDSGIAELSSRQFNARYPLQVKRRMAGPQRRRTRRTRRRRRRTLDRNEIRGILLEFARNVAAAENKADVVDVIGNVDDYVNRVAEAAGAR